MKKKYIFIIAIILIGIGLKITWDGQFNRSLACVTVKIVDEAGKPIAGANAKLALHLPKSSNPWDGEVTHFKKGKTNNKGECTLMGHGLDRISVSGSKEGYYASGTSFRLKEKNWIFKKPWNPIIELILREKVNPIPLYAKEVSLINFPVTTNAIGYDFMQGDWTKPYGNGKHADINFMFNYIKEGRYNYHWQGTVSMSSRYDGFEYIKNDILHTNSVYKFPYKAFEEGYSMTNLIYDVNRKDISVVTKVIRPLYPDMFFRVRTEKDNKGKVNNAFYGRLNKLDCNFMVIDEEMNVSFTYYLNPTPNDRNLEFNTKSNLFPNLDWGEKVNKP